MSTPTTSQESKPEKKPQPISSISKEKLSISSKTAVRASQPKRSQTGSETKPTRKRFSNFSNISPPTRTAVLLKFQAKLLSTRHLNLGKSKISLFYCVRSLHAAKEIPFD